MINSVPEPHLGPYEVFRQGLSLAVSGTAGLRALETGFEGRFGVGALASKPADLVELSDVLGCFRIAEEG